MWIKIYDKQTNRYIYEECEEINYQDKKINLFKDKKCFKSIEIEETVFFYIAEKCPILI